MASIIVRDLDESVKKRLAAKAKEHGRSMEAEAREILTAAVQRPNIALALLKVAREHDGSEQLVLPERDDRARVVDFE